MICQACNGLGGWSELWMRRNAVIDRNRATTLHKRCPACNATGQVDKSAPLLTVRVITITGQVARYLVIVTGPDGERVLQRDSQISVAYTLGLAGIRGGEFAHIVYRARFPQGYRFEIVEETREEKPRRIYRARPKQVASGWARFAR